MHIVVFTLSNGYYTLIYAHPFSSTLKVPLFKNAKKQKYARAALRASYLGTLKKKIIFLFPQIKTDPFPSSHAAFIG